MGKCTCIIGMNQTHVIFCTRTLTPDESIVSAESGTPREREEKRERPTVIHAYHVVLRKL